MNLEHKEHMWRTIVIASLVVIMGGAVTWLYAQGGADEFRARIEGALMLLFPALLDSLHVARRQKKVRRESLRPPPIKTPSHEPHP